MTSLNRSDILNEYGFVSDDDRTMIIGTDIDAVLSAAYLQTEKNWEVVGYYDLENVYYDSSYDPSEAVWVDLDVAKPHIESVGHHILTEEADAVPSSLDNSLNMNLVRGMSHKNYARKYPVSTLHALMWLHDYDADFSYEQKALCWLADSAWINGQSHRFKDNVQDWVGEMSTTAFNPPMASAIDTDMFEQTMEEAILPEIKETGFTVGRSRVESRHRALKGHQCSFDDPRDYEDRLDELTAYLASRLPFEDLDLPTIDEVEYGNRSQEYLSQVKNSWGSLEEMGDDSRVFSLAETFPGRVNYTTNINL